jgi:hypothetical protein
VESVTKYAVYVTAALVWADVDYVGIFLPIFTMNITTFQDLLQLQLNFPKSIQSITENHG